MKDRNELIEDALHALIEEADLTGGHTRTVSRLSVDRARRALAKPIPKKEMTVRWEIQVDAANPEEAAFIALGIQRDPSSDATVFDVVTPDGDVVTVDAGDFDDAA